MARHMLNFTEVQVVLSLEGHCHRHIVGTASRKYITMCVSGIAEIPRSIHQQIVFISEILD